MGLRPDTAFGCVFRYLFSPKPAVKVKYPIPYRCSYADYTEHIFHIPWKRLFILFSSSLQAHVQEEWTRLGLVESPHLTRWDTLKVGIQIRVGDWVFKNISAEAQLQLQDFRSYFECAEQIQAHKKQSDSTKVSKVQTLWLPSCLHSYDPILSLGWCTNAWLICWFYNCIGRLVSCLWFQETSRASTKTLREPGAHHTDCSSYSRKLWWVFNVWYMELNDKSNCCSSGHAYPCSDRLSGVVLNVFRPSLFLASFYPFIVSLDYYLNQWVWKSGSLDRNALAQCLLLLLRHGKGILWSYRLQVARRNGW